MADDNHPDLIARNILDNSGVPYSISTDGRLFFDLEALDRLDAALAAEPDDEDAANDASEEED